MLFRFKRGVLDVLNKEIANGKPARELAKKIGVFRPGLLHILNGGSMTLKTTVKFIKYFQKYYGWNKDEWKEKLVEV